MTIFSIVVNIALLTGTFIIVWYARATVKESRDALQKIINTSVELADAGAEHYRGLAKADAEYRSGLSRADAAFHAGLSDSSAGMTTTYVRLILEALESIEHAITESAGQPNA